MDIVTQGLLGASLAQSVARRSHLRLATIAGLGAGLLADADIFIRSARDPLLALEYHRHFTHSIFLAPVIALVAFLIFWPFLRARLPARALYLYCLMGALLSGFIDACTSYGTHLFWPLLERRIAWHIMPVVEPLFTACLLIGAILGFARLKSAYSRAGLALAGGYLLFALLQLQRAEEAVHHLAAERGHAIERLIVKPTLGNTILWRSIYLSDGRFYIDAVRVALERRVYAGTSSARFDSDQAFPRLARDTRLYRDIKRFERFSDGYVSLYPGRPDVLGDVRYAISPIGARPLWGIKLNLDAPGQHAEYRLYRDSSRAERRQFITLLLGRENADRDRLE